MTYDYISQAQFALLMAGVTTGAFLALIMLGWAHSILSKALHSWVAALLLMVFCLTFALFYFASPIIFRFII